MSTLYYESELYHHGIRGQKWGKRNGPPYPLGSGSKSSGEKTYGMSKHQVKSAIKKAKTNYRKNSDDPLYFSGSTGKNWDSVKNEHREVVKSDKEVTEQKNVRDFSYTQAINSYNRGNFKDSDDFQNYGDEAETKLTNRQAQIAKSFETKYADALLKDIGYSNIELGRKMLKEYGIDVSRKIPKYFA